MSICFSIHLDCLDAAVVTRFHRKHRQGWERITNGATDLEDCKAESGDRKQKRQKARGYMVFHFQISEA